MKKNFDQTVSKAIWINNDATASNGVVYIYNDAADNQKLKIGRSVALGSAVALSIDRSGVSSGSFIGDGSGLTGVTGDWDGQHTGNAAITGSLVVTQDISGSNLTGSFFTGSFIGDGSGLTGVPAADLWTATGSDIYYNTGDVGIGTTSPANYGGYTALTLNHATNGGLIEFQQSGVQKAWIYSENDDLKIKADDDIDFTVNTAVSSQTILSLDGGGKYVSIKPGHENNIALRVNGTNEGAGYGYLSLGLPSGVPTITAGIEGVGDAELAFKTSNSSSHEAERMRIDVSGNVGIGTDAPSNKLEVVGDMSASLSVKSPEFHGSTIASPAGTSAITVDGAGSIILHKGTRTSLAYQVVGYSSGGDKWTKILEFTNVLSNYEAPEVVAEVTLSPMGYSSGLGIGNTQTFTITARYSRDGATGAAYPDHMFVAAEALNSKVLDGWDPTANLVLTYDSYNGGAAVWIQNTSKYTWAFTTILCGHDYTDAGQWEPAGWVIPDDSSWDASFTSLGADMYGSWVDKTFGTVGIGTSTPDEILHIKQSEASTGGGHSIARVEYYATDDFADGDGCSIKFAGGDAGSANNVIGRLTVSRDGADTEGAFAFLCGTNGAEEFMRIASDGKIGAGVEDPQVQLDVAGSNTDGKSLQLRSGDTAAGTDSTQVMFSYAGNSYNSTGYAHSIRTRHNGGGESGNAIDFWLWDQGTDTSSTLGTKRVMTLDGDGAIYAYELDSTAGTNYVRYHTTTGRITYITSKKETKTNIKKLKKSDGIGVINQLRPIKFESKNERGNIRTGFVAEEVAEVDASLVSYGLDYKHHKTTGGIVTGSDGKKMVKSDKLVPQMWEFEAVIAHLVKAVQQHNTIIEKLKQEIEKMKKN